jgi:hypothetical protein
LDLARADEGHRMKRRELIAVALASLGWSLVARAQEKAMPVIGFLSTAAPDRLRLCRGFPSRPERNWLC